MPNTPQRIHSYCNKAGLKEKKTTGVLSFDIEKAFDRIWHDGLVYKLIKFKFPSYLTHIISSFVRDRSFYVKVGDARGVESYVECLRTPHTGSEIEFPCVEFHTRDSDKKIN